MSEHIFVGFGFGPIQSSLFVSEAFKSGNFKRIVIAEIDQKLVDAVRANNGSYFVNIASNSGISAEKIDGIEMFNPTVDTDRAELLKALSQATEIVTSLPSVNFYDMGENSVASLIKKGLAGSTAPATIIYTAENNNHAAEILEEKIGEFNNVQYLNTVIGKMSQVLNDKQEIADKQAAVDAKAAVEQEGIAAQIASIIVNNDAIKAAYDEQIAAAQAKGAAITEAEQQMLDEMSGEYEQNKFQSLF